MLHAMDTVLMLMFLCNMLLGVQCCVYKYGEDPKSPFSMPTDTKFTYELAGLDWVGFCKNGTKQSPINIPAGSFDPILDAARTITNFGKVTSNGANVKVINTQHVVQVEWDASALEQSNASVAVSDLQQGILTDTLQPGDKPARVPITPIQFHFHGHSEHSFSGTFFPVEMHIVFHTKSTELGGCTSPMGCLAVFGFMFRLADDDVDNPFLKVIFDVMPLSGNKKPVFVPAGTVFDLTAILPENKSYVTYEGSLTTPPCSEKVLWHVLREPLTMSSRQLKQFLRATADQECEETLSLLGVKVIGNCKVLGAGQNYRIVQPLGSRNVFSYTE